MKAIYIEARSKTEIPLKELKIREKKIGLVSTIQHLSQLKRIQEYLEKQGKKVFVSKGTLTKYPCQVLGCDVSAGLNLSGKVDAFLYIGSGDFHPLNLVLKTEKPVYLLHLDGILELFPKEKAEKFLKQKKVAYLHFLHADKVGIIVSTKTGQEKLASALLVKKALEKKGKQAFIFLCDTLALDELENYDCKVWINTACPGLALEKGFLNISDISDYLHS
ncbi:MAG: diphthamide synthesis protein [Nanoarchaeota archaeon]|nr:diphthamide synthesis protein [Nanoarchaeota archaeon]